MLLFLVGKALNTPWNSCGCLYYWYGVLCKISSWQHQPEFCLNLSSTRWSTKSNYKSKSIWANEAKAQLVITSNEYEKSPSSTQSTEKRTHMHRKTFFICMWHTPCYEVKAFVRFRIATIQMKTQAVEYGMWWLITECYRWFSSKKLKSDFWSSFLEATAYKLSTAKMCRAEFKPWWLLYCYAEIQGTFLTTSITLNIYRTFYSVTWLSQCYSTWHLSNNVFRF